MFDSPRRTRKKVQRLRRRGKLDQAITLQRQLCQTTGEQAEDWLTLAELAGEAEQGDLELAARVQVAKINSAGADEWLKLAEAAESAGYTDDAADAAFRAADISARLGDCDRAVELCDRVLAMKPDHRPAKQIRGIMERRLAVEDDGDRVIEDGSQLGQELVPDTDMDTDTDWPLANSGTVTQWPPEHFFTSSLESRQTPEARVAKHVSNVAQRGSRPRSPTANVGMALTSHPQPSGRREQSGPGSFVWVPQTWPSVLDWNCLMFVGGVDRIPADVLELAEVRELSTRAPIYQQGESGQLLYCLDEGTVRASRDRGTVQDFGTISAGSFFGEVSTITGFPSTATVSALGPCRLRVFTREEFQKRHQDGDDSANKLLSFLRTWYMEVAASLSPLLSHCSPSELDLLGDSSNWTTFKPGDMLAEEGKAGDLFTVIAGLTEVTHQSAPLGFLTSGDLVGAVDPSPVSVKAVSLVFALRVHRDRLGDLGEVTRSKVNEHMEECQRVLKWTDEKANSP